MYQNYIMKNDIKCEVYVKIKVKQPLEILKMRIFLENFILFCKILLDKKSWLFKKEKLHCKFYVKQHFIEIIVVF